MANSQTTPGVVAGRLPGEAYAENFGDKTGPLDAHEAMVAADRCYFCHDAPCVHACPTEIDIPLFIRQISTGQPKGAARTIFDQNILGGMCARVCPTENLCEGACVREHAEGQPVEIGRLQRYATDALMADGGHPYARAPSTGRRVAVVGAGPAGLACAHRLAMCGHDVVLMDAAEKVGGLNEYGIAAYKTPGDFAQTEAEWILAIGGIEVTTGVQLGRELSLAELREDYDAVFLGIGLPGVNALRAEGEAKDNVHDAVDFIARLRQSADKSRLAVGRNVVVIGGGMTAVDAAVQSKLLGAESVTMVYRRTRARMGASEHELLHAASKGVRIITGAAPTRIIGEGRVTGVEFAYTQAGPKGLTLASETFVLPADQVFKAIGQRLEEAPGGLELDGNRIAIAASGRTSLDGVWAGGDCVAPGDDLTVTAAAQGREVIFDAEHFFDGFEANAGYALNCLHAAYNAGARWIVLCDTNGGTLPHEIDRATNAVIDSGIPGEHLGIHTHDDTGNAVANTLAAVDAGVRQVQGTLNGLGERCGNANLTALIPTLLLKEPYASLYEIGVSPEALQGLTRVSRMLDDILNRVPMKQSAYVGSGAFAHKAGLHASAIAKNPATYEHVDPAAVGNARVIPMSNQAGQSNLRRRLADAGIEVAPDDAALARILDEVKTREAEGYSYDTAQASFELLARDALGHLPEYFEVKRYRVTVERRKNKYDRMVSLSEAVVVVKIGGEKKLSVSESMDETGSDRGPVNALSKALAKDLGPYQEAIDDMRLVDFKVRITQGGTEAVTRVIIDSEDGQGRRWSTVGVSANLVDASFEALLDAIRWKLVRDGVAPVARLSRNSAMQGA